MEIRPAVVARCRIRRGAATNSPRALPGHVHRRVRALQHQPGRRSRARVSLRRRRRRRAGRVGPAALIAGLRSRQCATAGAWCTRATAAMASGRRCWKRRTRSLKAAGAVSARGSSRIRSRWTGPRGGGMCRPGRCTTPGSNRGGARAAGGAGRRCGWCRWTRWIRGRSTRPMKLPSAPNRGTRRSPASPYDDWLAGVWKSPGMVLDLSVAALHGDQVIGFTLGNGDHHKIWSQMTATMPEYQGVGAGEAGEVRGAAPGRRGRGGRCLHRELRRQRADDRRQRLARLPPHRHPLSPHLPPLTACVRRSLRLCAGSSDGRGVQRTRRTTVSATQAGLVEFSSSMTHWRETWTPAGVSWAPAIEALARTRAPTGTGAGKRTLLTP